MGMDEVARQVTEAEGSTVTVEGEVIGKGREIGVMAVVG
jgi:hypothetical protein